MSATMDMAVDNLPDNKLGYTNRYSMRCGFPSDGVVGFNFTSSVVERERDES